MATNQTDKRVTQDALLELAERCEAALGPDRIIDALVEWPEVFEPLHVSQDVCGQMSVFWNDDKFCRSGHVPSITASIDAALTLKPEGHWWSVGYDEHGNRAIIGPRATMKTHIGKAATAALAICAAALRAKASQ
jgi:hypothetical protein